MASSLVASHARPIYALCLPLAALLGCLLADSTNCRGMAVIGLVITLLFVITPFGMWGFLELSWFKAPSLKYLYRNYHRPDPALHGMNTYCTRTLWPN